jgi:hypothetical protein
MGDCTCLNDKSSQNLGCSPKENYLVALPCSSSTMPFQLMD